MLLRTALNKTAMVLTASTIALVGCKKDDPAPANQKPAPAAKPTPGAQPATPAEAKPAEAKPAEANPTAANPTEAKPAEAQPTEAKPAEAKPAEANPTAAKPAEAKPADGEAKPAEADAKPAEAKPADDPAAKARAEMEARRKRIQEIYTLGRSKEAKDAAALRAIIVGDGPVYERASGIRALGREKRADVVEDLKKLVTDKATAVKIEAAIKLYQWGEQDFALPVLKELRKQGVALRRAFQTGYDKGKPTYDKNALAFFKDGIKNENVYVRLDSAVGLVELDKEKAGLPVIKTVLESEEKYHIRMAAVNYLTPLKTNESVRALLESATKDKDERVAKRARDVLGMAAPGAKQPAEKAVPDPKKAPAPGKDDTKPAEGAK